MCPLLTADIKFFSQALNLTSSQFIAEMRLDRDTEQLVSWFPAGDLILLYPAGSKSLADYLSVIYI